MIKPELLTDNNHLGTYATQAGASYKIVNKPNADNPLSVPAFYSGVRFISENLSVLPKNVLKKSEKGATKTTHYLETLLSESPNELVIAPYFWETLIGAAVMYGNGYAAVEKDKAGKVKAITNISPFAIKPFRNNGKQYYVTTQYTDSNGDPVVFAASEIFHLRNFSEDGQSGISVIEQLAQSLSIPIRLDEFLDKYFENGSATNLVVEMEKATKDDVDAMTYSLDKGHSGSDNFHKIMVLANAKAKSLTAPLKDFAFDILKGASIDDIARALRIPPTTLYALGRATWGNLDQLGTELVKYSFTPWVIKAEMECNRKLLTPQERQQGYYVKFNLEGLQRGDFATRRNTIRDDYLNGLISWEEWRELEDLSPDRSEGTYIQPLNYAAVDAEAPEAAVAEQTPTNTPTAPSVAPTPTTAPLNGAQIEAAVNVIVQLRAGVLVKEAAIELLVAVGLDRGRATEMVNATVAVGPLETVTEKTPEPVVAVEAEEKTEQKRSVKEQYQAFIRDALDRVSTKQLKAFNSNAAKREGDQYREWLNHFSETQGLYLGNALNPLLETVIADKTTLAFALQTLTEEYTQQLRNDKENADPTELIDKVITKYAENKV